MIFAHTASASDSSLATTSASPKPLTPHFEGKSKVIAITSGKGGVGKTFVTANLAAALAQRGRRVLVLDLDLGLANLDVVLNLYPRRTMHDVLEGKCLPEEVIVQVPAGFSVLPAGSGLAQYGRLTPEVRDRLLEMLTELTPRFDVVLLDTGAGISDLVLFVLELAQEVMVIVTPEPTSMTDAYAVIKVISKQQRRKTLRLVVNQTTRPGDGQKLTGQLQAVIDRFLKSLDDQEGVRLIHMGDIPADQSVKDAIIRRQLLMSSAATAPANIALTRLCTRLLETVLRQSTLAA